MDQEHSQAQVEGIRQLLSHLYGEIVSLEVSYQRVILVLHNLESVPGGQDVARIRQELGRSHFFDRWNALLDACEAANSEAGEALFEGIELLRVVVGGEGHQELAPELARIESLIRAYG